MPLLFVSILCCYVLCEQVDHFSDFPNSRAGVGCFGFDGGGAASLLLYVGVFVRGGLVATGSGSGLSSSAGSLFCVV